MGELGFLVRATEVRRLGDRARVVQHIHSPPPLSRSFAVVVREGGMDRGRGHPSRRFGDTSRGWIGGGERAHQMNGWKRMICWQKMNFERS